MSAQQGIMEGGDIFATHLHYILDYSWQAKMGDTFTGKQGKHILVKNSRDAPFFLNTVPAFML